MVILTDFIKNILVSYDSLSYIFCMKVTALLPDELMDEVKNLTHAKNTTESLISALTDWVSSQRIKQLNAKLKKSPLKFKDGFSASSVRKVNRS